MRTIYQLGYKLYRTMRNAENEIYNSEDYKYMDHDEVKHEQTYRDGRHDGLVIAWKAFRKLYPLAAKAAETSYEAREGFEQEYPLSVLSEAAFRAAMNDRMDDYHRFTSVLW